MADDQKRLDFLRACSNLYSLQCPSAAAYFRSKTGSVWSKTACLHCCSSLTAHTSTQHTLSTKQLRAKRKAAKVKGHDIPCMPGKSSRYILVYCKQCKKSFAIGSEKKATHRTPSQVHSLTPSQAHRSLSRTPKNTSSHRRSTLKNMLSQQTPSRPQQSVTLKDFLSSVQ